MSLNKVTATRAYALGYLRSRKIFAKLRAALSDADKLRLQAVLAELNEVQRDIYELSKDDYDKMQALTDALVERFKHPELQLH